MAALLPAPISRIGDSYYLFHAPTISHFRHSQRIAGLLTGTLPQASQQNVFLGLPLQLMPEEARLLVERGVAYVVDEHRYHQQKVGDLELPREEARERKEGWMTVQHAIGASIAEELELKKEAEKHKALEQLNDKARNKQEKRAKEKEAKVMEQKAKEEHAPASLSSEQVVTDASRPSEDEGSILAHEGFFLPAAAQGTSSPRTSATVQRKNVTSPKVPAITPTTSYPPLSPPSAPSNPSVSQLASIPKSYPLFKHLNDQGYFLSSGLRFGCQYMAYPGDPLRFHSHFMVIGRDWEEEIDLLSLVGVGRLGTGVKKGFLIGGSPSSSHDSEDRSIGNNKEKTDEVRCFCIEWAGM